MIDFRFNTGISGEFNIISGPYASKAAAYLDTELKEGAIFYTSKDYQGGEPNVLYIKNTSNV